MHRLRFHTLALLAGLLAAAPLSAQSVADFPPIRLGEQLSGSVPFGGPALSNRGPASVYRFDAEAGVRYSIEARSSSFDVYLILARPVGGLTEFLREDDDSAGDTDSRIRFTAERTEPLLLVVQPLTEGGSGSFTLLLEERVLPPAQPPRPITPGSPVQGSISPSSSVMLTDWDEELTYELWTFSGEGGEFFEIRMDSDDFDAYLEFGPMSGGDMVVEQANDDGGEGTNSRLLVQLPHDGTFGIRARPLSEGSAGNYTLQLQSFVPPPPTRAPITAGETVTSELDFQDAILENGISYEEWIYQGEAGERLSIRLASDDFDAYLSVGRMNADGIFQEIASNDDAPDDGLNSRVELTLPGDGEYVIRARSLSAGGAGMYTLEVRRGG